MKILNCPLNGPRNISEFVWGGEVKEMPDAGRCHDRDWADYVFIENNVAGVVREWWCHVPTSFWFIAERNTVTEEIIRTYPAGEVFNRRVDFAAKGEHEVTGGINRLPARLRPADRPAPAHRLHLRGPRMSRASPATPSPPRSPPMINGCCRAPSSIAGPAASSPWPGQDANTLVQIGSRAQCAGGPARHRAGRSASWRRTTTAAWRPIAAQIIELFGRFLPVGFYYKAFFRHGSWKFWETVIRNRAGLGQSRSQRPSRLFRQAVSLRRCGGGGRRAGRPVGRPRRRPRAGPRSSSSRNGRSWAAISAIRASGARGMRPSPWPRSSPAQVKAKSNIRVLTDAVCTGWFSDNWLPIVQANRLYKLRAKSVVMATGSLEQPAVFRNNDLPGVMHGTAAQRLIRLYGVRPGARRWCWRPMTMPMAWRSIWAMPAPRCRR